MMDFQENQWFENLFDALYQFTMVLDERGNVVKANRAALAIFGKPAQEILNIPFSKLPWPSLSRDSKRCITKMVNQAVHGRSVREELEFRTNKRSARIFDFSLKPLQDEAGNFQSILAEGRDITIYKLTSEALFQSEARYRSIYEEADLGIFVRATNGRLLDTNPAVQNMLGYSADELLQMDYLELTFPVDRDQSKKLFRELIAGKQKNFSIEKRYICKNGQILCARETSTLVIGSDGQTRYVIAMVENITLQKQIEVEMAELRQRLMHGREMERLRIAQDIHDGPLQELAGISYQIQSMSSEIKDSLISEQVEDVKESIKHLAGSLRSICTELRPPSLLPFGLEKTIISYTAAAQKAHPEISFQLDLTDDGLQIPEQARIALFRIYQEALNNIFRHSRAKIVKIRFWLTKENAFLEIQDDGIGFELPNRWITLARQGHLGLVGAQERAKETGGTLQIVTAAGRGTCIRAMVPLELNLASSILDLEGKL